MSSDLCKAFRGTDGAPQIPSDSAKGPMPSDQVLEPDAPKPDATARCQDVLCTDYLPPDLLAPRLRVMLQELVEGTVVSQVQWHCCACRKDCYDTSTACSASDLIVMSV